jgi:peptide deformylase
MIITNNEEALRVKCEPVLASEVGELVALLEKELSNSAITGRPGIGLAAPQIGIAKNIAIIRISDRHSVNLVNCRIEKSFDEFLFEGEGCLSFPDLREDTKRFNEIHVVDNLVYPHSFIATGLFAVCCQHELDHLNGILLPDKHIVEIIKQKPNEACQCGSNKKFKKCCYLKV